MITDMGMCEVCRKNPARHRIKIETMYRVIELHVCDMCYYTKSNAQMLMEMDPGMITLEMINKER